MKVIRYINKFRKLAAWALLIAFSGIYLCDLVCAITPEIHQDCLTGEMEGGMAHHQGTQSSEDHPHDTLSGTSQDIHFVACNPQLCTPVFLGVDFKYDRKEVKYVQLYTDHLAGFEHSCENAILPAKQAYFRLLPPPKIPNVRIFIQSFLN